MDQILAEITDGLIDFDLMERDGACFRLVVPEQVRVFREEIVGDGQVPFNNPETSLKQLVAVLQSNDGKDLEGPLLQMLR